ncbi:hypothetical protein FGIG_07673 [Fasciola gigantica]|uniref:Uncharacterized protein n=1 Tax=Fasciola gigantica TaxID=46835 RepID=A0A504Z367_FASGI|nr:hypothetical protein FGIG_07673 [Fasciola gigantica]
MLLILIGSICYSTHCQIIEDGHISAAPQPSTSPSLSVLCKESGLGSDSDHTPLSSPASVLDSIQIRQTAGAPQSKIWDPSSGTLRTARDSGAKLKPPQRAISLDCVWNPGVTSSDSDLESQISDTGPVSSEHYYTALERTPTKPEHDAISGRRSTRERSQTCDLFPRRSLRRLTMGYITHQLSAPRSDASDLYAPDMNTMEELLFVVILLGGAR